MTITTNLDEAISLLLSKGGYEPSQLTPLQGWLERGDDVLVFELADFGAIGRYPLYFSMPWERDEPTPTQAPDTTSTGFGWRYMPAMRVTVETADV